MPQEETKPKKKESKKSLLKDIIEIVIFLGLAVLLIFSFNWILGAALHTNSPLVIVTSESMEPVYYGSNRPDHGGTNDIRKDLLIVRGVDPSQIKVGDTIVFYRLKLTNTSEIDYVNEPIVHRVNRIYYDNITGEYWFTTKGDNNELFIDEPDINELKIHESRLIGKIIGRIGYIGGIIAYFKSPTGRWVLIGIIAVIFFITFLFGNYGDKEEEVFSEKESEDKAQLKSKNRFLENVKKIYRKTMKYKHIVFPSIIVIVIIFIPIIDTLSANWNSHFGITNIEFKDAEMKTLEEGNLIFVYADVTINCPGHWHQKFRSFSLLVENQTTGEDLGFSNWTIVYNFERTKTINFGLWINPDNITIGQNYNLTAIANLSSKFGRTWTDTFTIIFTLIL